MTNLKIKATESRGSTQDPNSQADSLKDGQYQEIGVVFETDYKEKLEFEKQDNNDQTSIDETMVAHKGFKKEISSKLR